MKASAFEDALALLARRDLSEVQLRQRLQRRGHPAASIESAVENLVADGRLNDRRAAVAIARSEVLIRRRGTARVRQKLAAAGIPRSVADEALTEVMRDVNGEDLLTSALRRRLPPDAAITTERQFARLYRFLIAQGFDPDRVMAALRARAAFGGER